MFQNHATLKQIRFLLLAELRQIYTENESDSISRLIMEHTGYPLTVALRDPDLVPPPQVITQIKKIVADIHTRKPIQYILGSTIFCDLSLKVNEHVLIPRPETEEMIHHILTGSQDAPRGIIDLGCGSGCIALALKQAYSEAEVWGVDFSKEALSVARENGRDNKLEVHWEHLDLLDQASLLTGQRFDLVVSNPPYVLNSEQDQMEENVLLFEPGSALFVEDANPLIFYRAIASFADMHLEDEGQLWVEINEKLGSETARIFTEEGFSKVDVRKDIHNKDRYINAWR
jgi:release factor glutamine methyltransferase